jgi:hypothetical protein
MCRGEGATSSRSRDTALQERLLDMDGVTVRSEGEEGLQSDQKLSWTCEWNERGGRFIL